MNKEDIGTQFLGLDARDLSSSVAIWPRDSPHGLQYESRYAARFGRIVDGDQVCRKHTIKPRTSALNSKFHALYFAIAGPPLAARAERPTFSFHIVPGMVSGRVWGRRM